MSDGLEGLISDAGVQEQFNDANGSLRAQLRNAFGEFGDSLSAEASSRAPHRTGDLAGSIKPVITESATDLELIVRPTRSYGRYVEFGTAPRSSTSTTPIEERMEQNRKRRRSGWLAPAQRPGFDGEYRTAPQPFMGPAWDSLRDQLDESLTDALERGIADASR